MTVAPYNHQSLQAEHGIKMLSQILTKHLTGQGQVWYKYLPLATFARNTFNWPNLANHCPYELVFGRKPKLFLDLETDPDMRVSGTHREYLLHLRKRLEYLHKLLQEFWMKRLALLNKDREWFSVQQWWFMLHHFAPNKSAKDSIKKGFHQVHRSFSSLLNSWSS